MTSNSNLSLVIQTQFYRDKWTKGGNEKIFFVGGSSSSFGDEGFQKIGENGMEVKNKEKNKEIRK